MMGRSRSRTRSRSRERARSPRRSRSRSRDRRRCEGGGVFCCCCVFCSLLPLLPSTCAQLFRLSLQPGHVRVHVPTSPYVNPAMMLLMFGCCHGVVVLACCLGVGWWNIVDNLRLCSVVDGPDHLAVLDDPCLGMTAVAVSMIDLRAEMRRVAVNIRPPNRRQWWPFLG